MKPDIPSMLPLWQRVRQLLFALLCVFGLGQPALAQSFSDGTMDPQGYVVSLFPQAGSVSVASSTAGNPGTALQMVFTVPAPTATSDHTETYLIYRNFVYDPATQGAVGGLLFTIDKSMAPTPSTVAFGNGQGFILEQGGRYYESDVALASVASTYLRAQTGLLRASDFYLLTDPANHIADTTVHPDFTAGAMRMGFFNGLGVPVGTPSLQMNYLYDNFGVTVVAVPEPSTATLWLTALGMGGVWLRRRAATRVRVPSTH